MKARLLWSSSCGVAAVALTLTAMRAPVFAADCNDARHLIDTGRTIMEAAQALGTSAAQIQSCLGKRTRPIIISPAGPAPHGAAGPPPHRAPGPAPHGAAGPPPHGAAGPSPFQVVR